MTVDGRALGFAELWWEAVARDAAMGYLFINLCAEIMFDTGGCPAVNVCLNSEHNMEMRNQQGNQSVKSLSTGKKISKAGEKRGRERSVQKQMGVRERHRMHTPLKK